MNTKNPIRRYYNWMGRNLVQISEEPCGTALLHYAKLTGKSFAIGLAISAVAGGIGYGAMKVYEKVTEKENY